MITPRCPTCRSTLDTSTGLEDFWTCRRDSCGNEWEPRLVDWDLTPTQDRVLTLLYDAHQRRAADNGGGYIEDGGFAAYNSAPRRTLMALAEAGLARHATEYYITDLGIAVHQVLNPDPQELPLPDRTAETAHPSEQPSVTLGDLTSTDPAAVLERLLALADHTMPIDPDTIVMLVARSDVHRVGAAVRRLPSVPGAADIRGDAYRALHFLTDLLDDAVANNQRLIDQHQEQARELHDRSSDIDDLRRILGIDQVLDRLNALVDDL